MVRLTANLASGDVVPGGYYRRKSEDYDKAHCLLPGDVLDFIYATQPKEWEKFRKQHGSDAKSRFFQRLSGEVRAHGTLMSCARASRPMAATSSLAYFRPASGLNYDHLKFYAGNIFSDSAPTAL